MRRSSSGFGLSCCQRDPRIHCALARSKRRGEISKAVTRRSQGRGSRSRSEEHTSELQSRLHLVCRLLLEKKKKKEITTHKYLLIPHTLHILTIQTRV